MSRFMLKRSLQKFTAVHSSVCNHFIEMLSPVRIGQLMNAAFPYLRGEHRTEPVPPELHRLMADIDAALAKNIFDLAQRQWIPDVYHHREANNLGRRVEISKWDSHPMRLKNGLVCLKPFCSDIAPAFHKFTD